MTRHHSRTTSVLLALAAVLLLSVVPAAAQTTNGAEVDKSGWWNRLKASESTPVAPVGGEIPTGVPDERLAVGRSGEGDPTSIAAIGIQPEASDGATVVSFILTIAEDQDAAGNQGTESPTTVIGACPITAFWSGGFNQEYEFRPEFDCELASSIGERSDEGVWTFDLQAIGALWLDPFSTTRADGVVLLPAPGEPGVFQTVFDPATITIDLVTTGGLDTDDGFTPTPTTSTTVPPNTGFANPGTSGGGSGVITRPTMPSPTQPAPAPTTTAPPTTVAVADDTGTDPEVAAPEAPESPPVSQIGNVAGNLPGIVIPGIIVLLAVLVAMSYWLGPAGAPTLHVRQRGVSRALDQRARSGVDS